MIWAIQKSERVLASPQQKATCPLCKGDVISKCGEIKRKHWAHKSNIDCDDWYEPESDWHLNWKKNFPIECQEVIIGNHRADVRTKSRWVIEFQNTPLAQEKIIEREKYYKRMVWVLNGKKYENNIYSFLKNKGYSFLKWNWFPKSWLKAKKDIYIDFNNGNLFLIKKIYPGYWNKENIYGEIIVERKYPTKIKGIWIKKEAFINQLK